MKYIVHLCSEVRLQLKKNWTKIDLLFKTILFVSALICFCDYHKQLKKVVQFYKFNGSWQYFFQKLWCLFRNLIFSCICDRKFMSGNVPSKQNIFYLSKINAIIRRGLKNSLSNHEAFSRKNMVTWLDFAGWGGEAA